MLRRSNSSSTNHSYPTPKSVQNKSNDNNDNDTNDDPMDDDDDVCVVCMDGKKTQICTPCGHLCLCKDCVNVINNKCPICRADCKVIQVFT